MDVSKPGASDACDTDEHARDHQHNDPTLDERWRKVVREFATWVTIYEEDLAGPVNSDKPLTLDNVWALQLAHSMTWDLRRAIGSDDANFRDDRFNEMLEMVDTFEACCASLMCEHGVDPEDLFPAIGDDHPQYPEKWMLFAGNVIRGKHEAAGNGTRDLDADVNTAPAAGQGTVYRGVYLDPENSYFDCAISNDDDTTPLVGRSKRQKGRPRTRDKAVEVILQQHPAALHRALTDEEWESAHGTYQRRFAGKKIRKDKPATYPYMDVPAMKEALRDYKRRDLLDEIPSSPTGKPRANPPGSTE